MATVAFGNAMPRALSSPGTMSRTLRWASGTVLRGRALTGDRLDQPAWRHWPTATTPRPNFKAHKIAEKGHGQYSKFVEVRKMPNFQILKLMNYFLVFRGQPGSAPGEKLVMYFWQSLAPSRQCRVASTEQLENGRQQTLVVGPTSRYLIR